MAVSVALRWLQTAFETKREQLLSHCNYGGSGQNGSVPAKLCRAARRLGRGGSQSNRHRADHHSGADGTIEPTRADSEWGVQADRATQRCMHARLMAMDITDGAVKDARKAVTNTPDDI